MIKLPPPGHEKESNVRGMPGGGMLKLQFDGYIYKERENSEPRTDWNSAEMAKVSHKNTDKVSRRQGKAFLFDSYSFIFDS